jgi:hypothetical protein
MALIALYGHLLADQVTSYGQIAVSSVLGRGVGEQDFEAVSNGTTIFAAWGGAPIYDSVWTRGRWQTPSSSLSGDRGAMALDGIAMNAKGQASFLLAINSEVTVTFGP